MNRQVEREIKKLYNQIFKIVFSQTNMRQLLRRNRDVLIQTAANIESSKKFQRFAEKFSKELAKRGLNHEKGLWRKYYKAARAARHISLPTTFEQFEKDMMAKVILTNLQMIKSIPQEVLKVSEHKYVETLINQVGTNKLPRGSFQKLLEKHGAKNAKVIARTETAKLQSAIVQNRATTLGSVAYIWRSSNDIRTRPSHREMNGVVVFFRDPMEKPLRDKMRGNAGEFPNCRCTLFPIFDEDDLTKSSYKVYDYRNDTIITMTQKQLIEAIQKGGLQNE